MAEIKVRSAQGTYAVHIGSGLLRGLGKHPLLAGRTCFVVTTPRVLGLHGQQLLAGFSPREKPVVLLVPDGEQSKRLRTVERLASELAAAGSRRDSVLLALGGGVIGDVTGFLAAIYQRGIDFVQIPTTVLAQVDASVGGKTGVNLPEGKNLLGSFHAPIGVFADVATLQTLSDREFRAGLFESIKAGIIRDPRLFRLLESKRDAILQRDAVLLEKAVRYSVTVKAHIVERDEHEAGERMLLNFGHTFGHALETALGYKTLLHGEAVAWGMLAALHLSVQLGSMRQNEADRAAELVRAYGPLPRFHLDISQVVSIAARDKKHTSSAQRYILASAIGSAFVAQGVPLADIRNSFNYILRLAGRA